MFKLVNLSDGNDEVALEANSFEDAMEKGLLLLGYHIVKEETISFLGEIRSSPEK
jgi:hypothetical protein